MPRQEIEHRYGSWLLRSPYFEVAFALDKAIENAIAALGVGWTRGDPPKDRSYFAYQLRLGPGSGRAINVVAVNLYKTLPPEFGIRLPRHPEEMGIGNPFPLQDRWDPVHHQWLWSVPSVTEVPDVAIAINLERAQHPAIREPRVSRA